MEAEPLDNTASAQQAPRSSRQARSAERRRRIFQALHDCVIDKGYTRTTLADIATGAGMSASHLLYYFRGKEDILEQYFENVSEKFLARIGDQGEADARARIEHLADLWFRGEASTRTEIGFMLECFGAAVHDEVLRVTKAEFDLRCKEHLAAIFEAAPACYLGDDRDAAEVAYAMMIGLRSAVYFDQAMDLAAAHRIFRDTLLKIASL
jgi:AcrR family transcriptional regulator